MKNAHHLLIRSRMLLLAFSTILLSVAAPLPAKPADNVKPRVRRVVLVTIPAVSLKELVDGDLPNFHKLFETGAAGLMNARTAGLLDSEPGSFSDSMYTPESGYATIGYGARALVGFDARQAYNTTEQVEGTTAANVLRRLSLIDPKSAEVVHTGIVSLKKDIAGLNYEVSPGTLGSILHSAGLKTAVIGNSDTQTPHREIATITMDSNGLTDFGNVGTALVKNDPSFPCSVRTNNQKLLGEISRCLKLADFTAIELGDLSRLERSRLDLMDGVFQRDKRKVLKESDSLLGSIVNMVDFKDSVLIVASPYPASYTLEKTGDSLCPIIIAGPGYHPGCLTSGSTRVHGAVAIIDIAPSILTWLDVKVPTALVGRNIVVSPKPGTVKGLLEAEHRMTFQNASNPLLRQSAVFTIILAAALAVLWLIFPIGRSFRRKYFPAIILFPTTFAQAMLILGAIPTSGEVTAWIGMVSIGAIILGISMLIGKTPIRALMVICVSTAAMILIDLGLGGMLTKYSPMSYSVIEGARYYGIGNEMMGTLIGASLVGIGLVLAAVRASDRAVKITLVCGLLIETMAIASPQLGAKVGGAITMLTGFGFALAAASKKPISLKKAFVVIIGVAAGLALFAVLDSLRGLQHQTHLGRAVTQVRTGGFDEMAMIVKRKMGMNIMLIVFSAWSRLVAAFIISAAVALKVGNVYRKFKPFTLYWRIILAGAVSGTLAALLFNDSGVVAAGTSLIYLWALMLLAALDKEEQQMS